MHRALKLFITLLGFLSINNYAQAQINSPTFAMIVKFNSDLPDSLVLKTMNDRKLEFEKLPGLVQKYYMHEPASGAYSGIYLWATPQDCMEYRKSALAKTVKEAYQIKGPVRIEFFDILCPLR